MLGEQISPQIKKELVNSSWHQKVNPSASHREHLEVEDEDFLPQGQAEELAGPGAAMHLAGKIAAWLGQRTARK